MQYKKDKKKLHYNEDIELQKRAKNEYPTMGNESKWLDLSEIHLRVISC